MITLNLISEKEKKVLKEKRFFIITKGVSSVLIVVVIILAGVLFFDKMLLAENIKTIETDIKDEESLILTQQGTTLEKSIKELNSQLQSIDNIQKSHLNLTLIIVKLAKLIPVNVQIDTLTLDKDTKIFSIKGLAKTRESLLELQNNLKSSSDFTKITAPITNITEKENIRFEYTGEVNLQPEVKK